MVRFLRTFYPIFSLQFLHSENVANVERLIEDQNLNIENRRGVSPLSVAIEKGIRILGDFE